MELTFGEQIKIILKRKNMTIRQLAELVEVQTGKPMSRQNLTQKLNRDNFQEQDMKEIAQALGCEVKISVVDPAASVPPVQNMAVLPAAEAASGFRRTDGKEEKSEGHISGKHGAGRLRAAHHTAVSPEPGQPEEKRQEIGEAEEHREQSAAKLAEKEAAATRQELPESIGEENDVNADVLKEIELALMESIQKELYPEKKEEEKQEVDTLAWARQKPLVWPTLTVPAMSAEQTGPVRESADGEASASAVSRQEAEMPPEPKPQPETEMSPEPELQPEAELQPEPELQPETEIASEPEPQSEAEMQPEPELQPETEMSPEPELRPETEMSPEPELQPETEMPPEPELQPEAEIPPEPELQSEAEVPSDGGLSEEGLPEPEAAEELPVEMLPFEEEPFSDILDLEDIPLSLEEQEEETDDLEFFDLEDFGEDISQVSAPYVMKREKHQEIRPAAEKKKHQETRRHREKEKLFRKAAEPENVWDSGGFDRIPEGGDVSFASAPYVIPREAEPEKPVTDTGSGEKINDETNEDTGETVLSSDPAPEEEMLPDIPEEEPKGFELPGRFSGSRGDISSVSAPYVIPREPEELPPGKPTGERGYWEERDESEEDDPEALSSEEFEEEPGEEEEPLSSDMEEKIASWDAAVKRQLQNPFLRALEGRARQAAKAAEEGRRTGASDRAEPGRRAGTDSRQEKAETGGEVETGRTARRLERAEEEEKLDLQGPAIDPDTGMEYETNTVKHHPTQPDMLLVYDKDEHRWIVQAERAFQNFQINKRTLLGKDYEPPVYLD